MSQPRELFEAASDASRVAELAIGLLDAAPDAMVTVDDRGKIRFVNRQAEQAFGYTRAELVGESLDLLIPDRFRARHEGHIAAFVGAPRTRTMGSCLDLRARRKDGSEFPVDVSLSPMSGPDGLLITAAIRDVTERDRAERAGAAAQREAEDARSQLEALLQNIPDFVLTLDVSGVIQFINRVQPHYSLDEVVGTSWLAYVPPDQHAAMQSALRQVLDGGAPVTFEVSAPGPDASLTWFASHIGPIRRAGAVVGAVLISRDITEKKRMEAQLLAAERMASMGTLAAGVAHEINNPLAAIIGNLDLALHEVTDLSGRLGLAPDLGEELRDALDAAQRVRTIVRDLKVFSRRQEDERRPTAIVPVLESTLRMAWNEIQHRARLVKDYGAVPTVEANEARLGQVFLNLILNAAQALPEGHAESNEIRISTKLDMHGEVHIEIADTGCGMPHDVRARLFEPFFTTKPAGVGTGLGLAICARLVAECGGRIEVESEVGRGSVFRVCLPSCPAPDAARPSASEEAPRGSRKGRVLVVDDEVMLGNVIRRSLLVDGHDVVVTASAPEALKLVRGGERFDVILCDLMMPEMGGEQFLEELQRDAPDHAQRVVFVTGGAFTPVAQAFLERVGNLRIEKPFDPSQLRALVNGKLR